MTTVNSKSVKVAIIFFLTIGLFSYPAKTNTFFIGKKTIAALAVVTAITVVSYFLLKKDGDLSRKTKRWLHQAGQKVENVSETVASHVEGACQSLFPKKKGVHVDLKRGKVDIQF